MGIIGSRRKRQSLRHSLERPQNPPGATSHTNKPGLAGPRRVNMQNYTGRNKCDQGNLPGSTLAPLVECSRSKSILEACKTNVEK